MKVLISACLLGIPCRYDGKSKEYSGIDMLTTCCEIIPFCPECYGGLPTPRVPCEISKDKVLSEDGRDFTFQYKHGAQQALNLCRKLGITYAVLKEKSPSCGKDAIYDGTFSKKLISGKGITAKLLSVNGIEVYCESEISSLLEKLNGECTK